MEYTEVVPQRFDFRPEFKFLLGFSRGMCKYGYPTYPFDKRFRIFVKDLFDNATIAKGFPPDIYEEIEIIKRNIESYFDDDIGIVYDPEWKVFQNDFFRIYSQGKEYNKPDYYPWIKKNKGYSEDIYCFGENILSAISPLFESLNNDEYMRLGKFLSNLYGVCNDYESSFVTSLDKYYNECVVYFPEIAAKISTQCKFDGEKEFGKWKDDIDFAFNLVCEFGMGKIEEIQEIEFENFPVLSKTWDIFRESLKAIECDTRSAKHTKTPPPSHNQCPISPAREHVHQDSSNENCQSTKSDQSYDHIIEFKKRPLSPQDAGKQYGPKKLYK